MPFTELQKKNRKRRPPVSISIMWRNPDPQAWFTWTVRHHNGSVCITSTHRCQRRYLSLKSAAAAAKRFLAEKFPNRDVKWVDAYVYSTPESSIDATQISVSEYRWVK